MARSAYSKRVKFFIFDTIILIPLLLLVIVPSKTMLYISLTAIAILWFLNKKGLNLDMLFRKLRVMLIGKMRYIRPSWRKEL
tara:strand:+ start:397 stop:642 length:246 start_codon:yes stop_codon:yes gene_type:complete